MSRDIDPVSLLKKAVDYFITQPWKRVRGVHESAPDPGMVRWVYQLLMMVFAAVMTMAFFAPIIELIAIYAFFYYTIGGIIKTLEVVGILS